nr:MAG TPA: hypothetical protein [Caudoviricetes sp.]
MQERTCASPFSDAVHVQDGGGVEQLHLGNVCHVCGIIADVSHIGGSHDAAHRHQFIHLDVTGLVHVTHHAVGLTGACTLAPAAAADEQLTTILDSGVVLHQEVVDGFGCQIGHHGGQDVVVLLIRQQDVVGDGIGVILAGSPHSAQQVVHVLQDLLRGLILPLGRGGVRTIAGSSGLGDIGVVQQAGGAVVLEAGVDVGIHVLVVGQADAVLQQLIQAAADEVGALHVHEVHTQSCAEQMCLVCALCHISLNDGSTVGTACAHSTGAGAAGDAVSHVHGGDVIDPAAAGLDGDIAGIGDAGEGLADQRVTLFQLTGQECATRRNACCVHGKRRAGRRNTAQLRGKHTGIESADILEICHILFLLLHVLTGENDQLGHAVCVCRASPLAAGQLHGVGAVLFGFKAAYDGIRVRTILDDADVHRTATLGRAFLAQHVDAAALEYAACITGGVCTGVLVDVGQGRAHLAACNTHKLVCGDAGALHQDDSTVRVIHQGHAKGQRFFCAYRAGDNNHIGLACVGTGKAVVHFRANDLRVELRKCHRSSLLMLVRVECVICGLRFLAGCFISGAAGTVCRVGSTVLRGLVDACQQCVHAVFLAGVSIGRRLVRLLCLLRQSLYQRGHGVQDSVQLGIHAVFCRFFCRCRRDAVLGGGSFGHRRLSVLCGCGVRRRCGFSFRRGRLGSRCGLLFGFVHCGSFLRRCGGTVLNGNQMPCAPSGHDGNMVPSDIGLAVSCAVRHVAAPVAAGYLPCHAILHVGDQTGVLQVKVGDQIIALPADVLRVALGVKGMVFRRQAFRRVILGHILALKAGNCRRVEHIFRAALHLHKAVRVAVKAQLPGKVFLLAYACNGHVVADEEAFRRSGHVFADFTAVIGNQGASPPKNGYKKTRCCLHRVRFRFGGHGKRSPSPDIFHPRPACAAGRWQRSWVPRRPGRCGSVPTAGTEQATWHGPVLCRGRL